MLVPTDGAAAIPRPPAKAFAAHGEGGAKRRMRSPSPSRHRGASRSARCLRLRTVGAPYALAVDRWPACPPLQGEVPQCAHWGGGVVPFPRPVMASRRRSRSRRISPPGARTVYPGTAIHPALRRRDPSSASPPQDDSLRLPPRHRPPKPSPRTGKVARSAG